MLSEIIAYSLGRRSAEKAIARQEQSREVTRRDRARYHYDDYPENEGLLAELTWLFLGSDDKGG